MIEYQREYNRRLPYPLDWEEQKVLFSELALHLHTMALFAVNTGLRDQELCRLEWAWEQRVPELDTPTIKRSVFLLPGTVTKNGRPRLAILNDVAQSIVEGQRGEHNKYVFTYLDFRGERTRLGTLRNSGWIAARRRASVRYREEFGKEPPRVFQRVRAHDLRHVRPTPTGRWRKPGGPSGLVGARSWSGDDALQLGRGRELGEGRKRRQKVPRISHAHSVPLDQRGGLSV